MKDVFVIAMEFEADAVLRHMTEVVRTEERGRIVCQGKFRGESAAVVICGLGKVNAAAGTQYAIDRFSPERIINIGVAGGLDPSMRVGEVCTVTRCFQCDFDLSEINGTPKGTPDEYTSPYFELASSGFGRPGDVLRSVIVSTGDSFVNDDDDLDFVFGEMGATLRDMELAAIAHVCRRAGVICCALKAVSDVHVPGNPPPISQYKANLKLAVDALAVVF